MDMRWLVALTFVLGCAREDSAEPSAKVVAAAPAPAVLTAPAATPSCGKMNCAGGCNHECGGTGNMPAWAAVPTDAHWTKLHVTGMHCGGCARRIERAL